MSLKKFLDAGNSVVGTNLDSKLKPLSKMSFAMQRRHGYVTEDGSFTDRGYERATSDDIKKLDEFWRWRKKMIKQESR